MLKNIFAYHKVLQLILEAPQLKKHNQVFFGFSEGPKRAKNNRKMPIFQLLKQPLRQNKAKTVNGEYVNIKNGTTFTNKLAVQLQSVYNFQKVAIFHMFLGQMVLFLGSQHELYLSQSEKINFAESLGSSTIRLVIKKINF